MLNSESVLENETHKLLWDFEIQTDLLISERRPNLIIINQKKITCRIVDFTVSADHRVKLKENGKEDKYLDHTRDLKKQWNMKGTITPTVIGALGKVTKGLVQGLEDLEITERVESIFEVDQRRPFANGPENKKTNDHAQGIVFQRWRWQTICVKKRGRQRTCEYLRQRWRIDTTTRRLHREVRRKIGYSHQKHD